MLRYLADTMEDQIEKGNWRWLERIAPKVRNATELAQDIQQHEGRRTMGITNGKRSDRKSIPAHLIGYQFRSSSSPQPNSSFDP